MFALVKKESVRSSRSMSRSISFSASPRWRSSASRNSSC